MEPKHQRVFTAIHEPVAGYKWQASFRNRWPAYKVWLEKSEATDPKKALIALKKYMPEMIPLHRHLCDLVGADDLVSTFLTGFQPPAYFGSCSQAVSTVGNIALIRNYDYHVHQFEGLMLSSAWNGKKVIANSDCLIGALDGMNEDGLVVSLTFGGRPTYGYGFGIPFILRYILEFCSTVTQAVAVLHRVPSHMSYNVTLADRSGNYRTVEVAPDRKTRVFDTGFATNHQGKIDWNRKTDVNKTGERAAFLYALLNRGFSIKELTRVFLKPPLYNTDFAKGYGTLYTAIYRPVEGYVELRWPKDSMVISFDYFTEQTKIIHFNQPKSSAEKSAEKTH